MTRVTAHLRHMQRSHIEAMFSLRRALWFSLGLTALTLAGLGVLLPLLPTTPFVIVAAFAFSKSSPRLEKWLLESRAFGPVIVNWREEGAIAPQFKLLSMVLMLGVLIISVVAGVAWWILALQTVFMLAAALFVLSRPNGRAFA
ncbi:MAG: YbaN family protein [Pseudomonadota bacterium]